MTNQDHHLVRRSLIRLIIAALLGTSPIISLAQTTDISGSGLNTAIHPDPNGTTFNIDGGTRPNAGSNLYHSFGDFSLANGHTALFRNVDASGADGTGFAGTTANIFGRVTGGHPSSIFGTIDSARNFPTANLWLINPAGMVFGPTASINVGGSANFSTADYLRMSDNALFFASPNQATTLSVAPAIAFGFLGGKVPQPITLEGTGKTNPQGFSTFFVPTGKTLSFVGGDITLNSETNLHAPSGQINIASVASPGEVVLNPSGMPPALDVTSFTQLGTIQMVHATLDASGDNPAIVSAPSGGGTVLLRGGQLIMHASDIEVLTRGNAPGAPVGVDIRVSGAASMDGPLPGNNSGIRSITFGNGHAGSVSINAASVEVADGASIQTETAGGGHAGDIIIQATDHVTVGQGSSIDTFSAGQFATGGGGTLTIGTPELILDGGRIFASTFGVGSAGLVNLNVGKLSIINGGAVETFSGLGASTTNSPGPAGSVSITATDSVVISGSLLGPAPGDGIVNSGIYSGASGIGAGSGSGGPILIVSPTLAISNGGQLSSSTSGVGNAGAIIANVRALNLSSDAKISSDSTFADSTAGSAGAITIQGIGGSGSAATSVNLDHSTISTTMAGGTSSSKPAAIDITTQTINLMDSINRAGGGNLQADTSGAAPAGDIILNVGTLTADGLSLISSSSGGIVTGSGNAGNVIVRGPGGSGTLADSVTISQSEISTEANAGAAGSISLASNSISLGGALINSRVNGSDISLDSGPQANITFTAKTLLIQSSTIQADVGKFHPTSKAAGNITFNVGTFTAENGGQNLETISSIAGPFGSNAGTVTFNGLKGPGTTAENIHLDNSIISTTISGGNALSTPATIVITAQAVNLTNGAQIKADTSGAAPAGDIIFNVGTLTTGSSTISSSSSSTDPEAGNAGSITIQGTGRGSSATNVSLDNSTISTTIAGGTSLTTPATIDITTQKVTLTNGIISADTNGAAPAGDITIQANTITMNNASSIQNETHGFGKAGLITITGAGSAPTTIAGGIIQAQSETSASAGNITIQAPGDLTLLGTTLSVKSTGAGNAGSIGLLAGNDLLVRNSQVSTESAQASGGDIKLTAPNIIRLVDSTVTSSVQGQTGSNGGNINIDPQFVILQRSSLLANANAGAGGNISIAASGAVLVDPNSRLDATAGPAGISGSVNISSPIQVLSGVLVPLKQEYAQAGLSGDRCAADPNGQFSSFVQVGRDGVPQTPGNLTSSPLGFLDGLQTSSLGTPGQSVSQIARLGLFESRTNEKGRILFFSGCRS